VRWYRLAAQHGDASGRVNLAWAYINGDGVSLDSSSAYFWALLAQPTGKEIGGHPIREFLENLRSRISSVEAGRVEAAVEEWRRDHVMSEQGWYLVNLPGGPCYIAVSKVSLATN